VLAKLPWYYGWNVLGVGLIFQAIMFGSVFFTYTLWVNQWVADPDLDATLGGAMWGITVLTVAQGMLAPFAGRAMDSASIRVLVCAGAASAACGFLLVSRATAIWQIVLVYGSLIMLGTLLSGPLAAQTLAAKWFSRRRGLAIGLSTVGTSLGGLLLAPWIAWLFVQHGWRTTHVILAALMLVVIVPLAWVVVRNTPSQRGVAPEPAGRRTAALPAALPPGALTTGAILRSRNFWVIVVAFTPMVTAFGGIQQNLAPFARDGGIDDQQIAWLIALFSGVMIAGKVFFGAMADRYGHRGLYGLATGTLAVTILLMLGQPGIRGMMLVSTLLGFAAGGFLPLLGAIVGSRFGPEAFGRVLGLIGPFMTLSALGPPLAGGLRDATGSYQTALLVFAVILLPAAIAMMLLSTPGAAWRGATVQEARPSE
jgi:MFS family permease